jgi:hypothetical protein
MTSPIAETALCTLNELGDKTYEIVFHRSSNAAVDEWMAHVERLHAGLTAADTARWLLDASQTGDLPMLHVLRRSQEYVRAHPDRPMTRTATLYRGGSVRLLLNFTRWMQGSRREQARFFTPDEREAALAWLLAE